MKIIWASNRENLILLYANKKAADKPGHLQSDQHLCSLLFGKYYDSSWYPQNFDILASLCSCAAWLESYLVGNPENIGPHVQGDYKRCFMFI